jgi:hypothetical protein
MSDSADEIPVEETAPPTEQAFKVISLRLDEKGVPALWGKRHTLSAKIYDKKTALRYAVHEAQQVPSDSVVDTLFTLVSPTGRCTAVLVGGSGKAARGIVALRTKRALVQLAPQDVVVRRRTSRPLLGVRPARRRTSRGRV